MKRIDFFLHSPNTLENVRGYKKTPREKKGRNEVVSVLNEGSLYKKDSVRRRK